MNEIPRRSFLALLGAAVVAAKLPAAPAEAEPLAEIVETKSEPITVLRRWWITDIVRHGNQATVHLGEAFITEDFAVVAPSPTIVMFKDIVSCSVDRPFEHLMTSQGPVVQPLPSKAEIEVSYEVACDILKGTMNGRDFVEFAGDAPI